MVEAVLQVARTQLGRELGPEETEALRAALAPRAAEALVTYRIEPGAGPRPVAGDPSRSEYAVTVLATLDGSQVRKLLTAAGWLGPSPDRPSVVVVAQVVPGESEIDPSLPRLLTQALSQRLGEAGYIVLPPPPSASPVSPPRSALEVGKELGSDVALDADLRWIARTVGQSLVGGSLEVSVRARRTRDGSLLASSRFDAPAYHTRLSEAQRRALAALQNQVADNVVQQLRGNWTTLAGPVGPLEVRLADVAGLAQVEAVQRALLRSLGAKRASIERLAPGRAVLEVEGTLSPGALAERLAASSFPGFRLEKRGVLSKSVELRLIPVASLPDASGASATAPAPAAGTGARADPGR